MVNITTEIDVLKKAIEKWGPEKQQVQAIEEMAELTQALTKNMRGNNNRDNIIEEIDDVETMIKQLKLIHDISDQEILNQHIEKINRLENLLIK